MHLNNTKTDLVYINDGTWSNDYDKANGSLSKFNVLNDGIANSSNDEFPLYRKIEIEANTRNYISAYKLVRAGGLEKDLSAYKSIKFTAAAKGTTTLKITLVKKGITNWADQYTYTITVDDTEKEYAVSLSKFVSALTANAIDAKDITAICFTWLNNRGVMQTIGGSIAKTRFVQDDIANTQALAEHTLSIYPNPSTGKFVVSFSRKQNLRRF